MTERNDKKGFFSDAEIIASYSRAQAIEDGVLVDVSQTAQECGFRHPVAVTVRVWAEVVQPDEKAGLEGQSESGRLWDVLWMLRTAIYRAAESGEVISYKLLAGDSEGRKEVTLKAVCGPGDEGKPVITIMMPDED